MDMDALFDQMQAAIERIDHPRFFETERGFQGELRAQLERQAFRALMPEGSVIEQEYQKRLQDHGLTIRPDIIIHEPFDPKRHKDRTEGNVAVIELKLNANGGEAVADFVNLIRMMDILHYPVGLFINIASPDTHAALVPSDGRGRIACFSTMLCDGRPRVLRERTA